MIAFKKEQLSEVMCKHAEKENGLHDLMEIMLESLMVAERGEFLREQEDHIKGNGYRFGHSYGHVGWTLTLSADILPRMLTAMSGRLD